MSQSYESVLKGIAGHEEAIRRNEALLAANPEGYKKSLKRFAILGYCLYALILVSAIFCGFVCFVLFREVGVNRLTIYFAIFTVIYLFATIASLFIPHNPPFLSTAPTPQEAPELWDMVNQLASTLQAPTIDKIYLTFDMNASAAQWPRFGLFGRIRNILTIGIPLMMASDEDALRTVIAHEFGHFAGEHGKQSGFVYRSGQLFGNLYQALASSNNAATFMIRAIVNRYYPKLEQKLLPVSRIDEYEADRVAVQATGLDSFRRMMIRLPAIAAWHGVYVSDKVITTFPEKPLDWMTEALRNPMPNTLFESELTKAIEESTDLESTHPCLTDRLKAQVVECPPSSEVESLNAEFNVRIERTAYEALINPKVGAQIQAMIDPILLFAQEDFRRANPMTQTASIDSLMQQETGLIPPKVWKPKDDQTSWQQFRDIGANRLDLGDTSFFAAVKTFGESHEADPLAVMLTATVLVENDRDYAISKLKAINMIPSFALIVNRVLVALYQDAGDSTAAGEHYEICRNVEKWINILAANLKRVSAFEVLPPDLSPMQMDELRNLVDSDDRITAAHVCRLRKKGRSQLKFQGDLPVVFIDCLSTKQAKWRWTGQVAGQSEAVTAKLQEEISTIILPIALVEGAVKWHARLQKPNDALKIK